jgi:hypothetical protein
MFSDCTIRADFLRKIIKYENLLSPNEFLSLLSDNNSNIPDIGRDQLNKTVKMIYLTDKQIHSFSRKKLSSNVNFYQSTKAVNPHKSLLICFCGHVNRLFLPIPVFLQSIPEDDFDVLIYSDPSGYAYLTGVPEFSNGLNTLFEDTQKFIDFKSYKRLITLGTSGGGSAALYFGVKIKAEKAISVCGKHRALSKKLAQKNTSGMLDVFQFDKIDQQEMAATSTQFKLVFGEKNHEDTVGALSLRKHMKKAQLLSIKDLSEHNAFMFFLIKGKLSEFIHNLLETEV